MRRQTNPIYTEGEVGVRMKFHLQQEIPDNTSKTIVSGISVPVS